MRQLSGWKIASLVAIIGYAAMVIIYSDNLPKYDDLHDVFGFFIEYHKADAISEKIHSFFFPNNEHVTLINHVAYWLQLNLLGELDFRQLVWFGNLFIIGTALLACRLLPKDTSHIIYFFVIAGYLSLSYWDSSFKAMTAISNQTVIFFAVLCLVLARQKKWLLACFAAFACQYSQINGLFIWPLLLIMAYLTTGNFKRQTSWLLVAALISTVCYFSLSLSHRTSLNAALPESLKSPEITLPLLWQVIASNLLLPFEAFISFIGSSWLPNQFPRLITLTGLVLLTVNGYYWLSKPQRIREQLPLFLFICFLAISMASIAFTRALIYQDPLAVTASRYKMYSLLFSLLTIAPYLIQSKSYLSRLVAALAVSIASLSALPHALLNIQHQTQGFRNSLVYWLVDGDFRRLEAFHIYNADSLLFHAEYLGVWNPYRAAGLAPLRLTPSAQPCQAFTQLPYCHFQLQHRLNGLAVQLINPSQLETGSRLQFCSSNQPAYISDILSESQRQQTRLLIDRARISHHYQYAILHKKNTALCQTPLQLGIRDRELEIKDNMNH